MCLGLQAKYAIFLLTLRKYGSSRQPSIKVSNRKFQGNRSVQAALIQARGQADRRMDDMTKPIGDFRDYANKPKINIHASYEILPKL
jgi:hypothetical protein